MKTDETKITIRMPVDTHAFFSDEARHNGSSLNSEVLRALRERKLKLQQEIKTATD